MIAAVALVRRGAFVAVASHDEKVGAQSPPAVRRIAMRYMDFRMLKKAAFGWRLIFVGFVLVRTASADAPSLENLPPHPRLFAKAERWTELKAQVKNDPVSGRLAEAVTARAEHTLTLPAIRYEKEGRRLLRPIREGLSRILTLAMAARLNDDARFRERAIDEANAIATLPDWNPSHFLDTAEATFALAIGYDWLFEHLTPDDRALLVRAIIEKGLQPSFEPGGKLPGWAEARNNWTQVCNSGLVAGAIAIAPREPELGRAILERALVTLPAAAELAYAPDGAYPEGPLYWGYGTTFHVILADALENALGSTFGTDNYPGFRASAHYVNQMTGPTGAFFNYADGREERGFAPAMFWFARKERDRAMLGRDLARLEKITEKIATGVYDENVRFLPFALLWWDPALATRSARAPVQPLSWMGRGLMPVAVHRSAWDDPEAWFVGIKGGPMQASHAHMDLGAFVLEAGGVRWAVDPGAEDYHELERRGIDLWAYHHNADRWRVFRIGSEGHNILRFEGADQDVGANAAIVAFSDDPKSRATTVDLTSSYSGYATQVRRTVRLEESWRVVIEDEWITGGRSVDVAWQWLTRAAVEVDEGGAVLRQNGKALRLRVVEPKQDWTLTVEAAAGLMKPYDRPEPELRRLVLHTRSAAGASGRIRVIAELE